HRPLTNVTQSEVYDSLLEEFQALHHQSGRLHRTMPMPISHGCRYSQNLYCLIVEYCAVLYTTLTHDEKCFHSPYHESSAAVLVSTHDRANHMQALYDTKYKSR